MNKRIFKEAFIRSLPVLSGYMVLGMGYGILLEKAGYGVLWAFMTSLLIYAGAMQFVLVTMLTGGISLAGAALTTLMVNARHLFYGISMTDLYKGAGAKKPYMIFALTDETYSILCSGKCPEGMDFHKFAFVLSMLDHSYWVTGSVIGSLIGSAITFDTGGIEFSMTALFITVFVEQWLSTKHHLPALIGLAISIICLVVFGSENFLIPAMIGILCVLTVMRRQLDSDSAEDSTSVESSPSESEGGDQK